MIMVETVYTPVPLSCAMSSDLVCLFEATKMRVIAVDSDDHADPETAGRRL